MWLVDEVTDRLRPAGIHIDAGATPILLPSSFERGSGLAGICWARNEIVWVPDIHAADSPVLPEVAASSEYRAAGAVPVRSADKVVGVLTFFTHEHQDPEPALATLLTGISGHIGAYLERRRAEELANQLAASIGEYVALVGHELRTPLTSIGTYTDLIAESGDDTTIGEVRDLIAVIERNNARLRTLVERLLDLAALESGHAQLTVAAVDLVAVVAAIVSEAGTGEPGPAIHTELPGQLIVPGDPLRLRQVAENLISNAVKYSPADSTVEVSLTTAEDTAVLTVTDAGMGIPAGERDRLFARLYRASNARHSGIPGTGLGLSLTRLIVGLHGGTISLREGERGGTVATVRLPL
jgi:signal transduction histidine kinase